MTSMMTATTTSTSPADALAVIDPLFSVLCPAPDQIEACYFTERNVNQTREVYRNRGGLKALQRIIASLAPTFEPWIASLNLQTPEAAKIVRKSLELGCFWASLCFWKERGWSEQEYVRRLRCPALWTAASWVMDMLNDELGVPTEAVIQIHQDGWDGIFVFDSLPAGTAVAHVNECLRAMRHGVWTVRQWMDEFWWAPSCYPQLEAAVKGYLDTQYQRTSFDTLDEFLEYRCKSAGGAPIHLLMAILKRDVEFSSADPAAHRTINNNNEGVMSSSEGLRSDHQSSTDDEEASVLIISNNNNRNNKQTKNTPTTDIGASSDDDESFMPEQFGCTSQQQQQSGARLGGNNSNNKAKLKMSTQGSKPNHRKPSPCTIPMGLLDLSTVQTTAINDILDHERDAAEGSPNLVNFMHSQIQMTMPPQQPDQREVANGSEKNANVDKSTCCCPADSPASSLSDALASALLFHRRITHDLQQDVGRNPAGILEKQAAQVAYGCYLMEVLHPRYSELASQIAALYPPPPSAAVVTATLTNAKKERSPPELDLIVKAPCDDDTCQVVSVARSQWAGSRECFALIFKLLVLLLLVTVCN